MKAQTVYNNAAVLAGYSLNDNTLGLADGSEDILTALNRTVLDLKEEPLTSLNEEITDAALIEALTYGVAMFIAFRRRDAAAHKFLSECYNAKRTAFLSRVDKIKNIYEGR